MDIIYMNRIKSKDEVKEIYRRLCKQYHPDVGGNVRDMQIINDEYNYIQKFFNTYIYEQKEKYELLDKIEQINGIIRIKHVRNVSVLIINDTIWIIGNTFTIKDYLKAKGCKWSQINKSWYWNRTNSIIDKAIPELQELIKNKT